MKRLCMAALALASSTGAFADSAPSPIYGVTIPDGYRQWGLVAPAQEADPLNELRVVLGNSAALKAYREGKLPFPDGTVLAKLAWKHEPSPDFKTASIPGAATTVQFMVKDSKNTRPPVAGGLDASSMANPPMKRSTRRVLPATRRW